MIRVAHVITQYSSVVSILLTKLRRLAACRELAVAVISSPPPAGDSWPAPPVRHLGIPMTRRIDPAGDCRSIRLLRRVLRDERFDVVHTHTAKAGFIGAVAARWAGVPLVVHTCHGLPFYAGQPRFHYHLYRSLEKLACRCRDHVFSQNRRDMEDCIRLMGSKDRVSYEGNGVDAAWVRDTAREHLERARRDYPPGDLKLAMVSRLEPVKRVGDFLAVCQVLLRRGLRVSAVVAGEGPMQRKLESELLARGLAGHVRLTGWAPHAVSLLAIADIVVLTSEKEGIPRALMEAMALGKPVVATDVPGTQELVADGATGVLTPLGRPDVMADAIAALAADPAKRAAMGQAGFDRVCAEFNDCRIADRWRDFYISRLGTRPGRCAATDAGSSSRRFDARAEACPTEPPETGN